MIKFLRAGHDAARLLLAGALSLGLMAPAFAEPPL